MKRNELAGAGVMIRLTTEWKFDFMCTIFTKVWSIYSCSLHGYLALWTLAAIESEWCLELLPTAC